MLGTVGVLDMLDGRELEEECFEEVYTLRRLDLDSLLSYNL